MVRFALVSSAILDKKTTGPPLFGLTGRFIESEPIIFCALR